VGITGLFLSESSLLADVISKISSWHKFHDQVKVFSILEGMYHIHKRSRNKFIVELGNSLRMLEGTKQVSFVHDRIDTSLCDNPIRGKLICYSDSFFFYLDLDISFMANICFVFLDSTFQTYTRCQSKSLRENLSVPCRNLLFRQHNGKQSCFWTQLQEKVILHGEHKESSYLK
jgi:hypothetical protein